MSRDGQRRRTVLRRGSGRIKRDIPLPASAFSFTERTPLEHGFADVFRDRIVPVLRRQEKRRRERRGKAMTGIGVSALAGAAGAAAGFLLEWGNATLIAPFLALAAGFISYGHYQKKWTAGLVSEAIPVMCDFLGAMQYGGQTLSPAVFEDLGVVPTHTGARLDDTVTGSHNGRAFTLTEPA